MVWQPGRQQYWTACNLWCSQWCETLSVWLLLALLLREVQERCRARVLL